MLQVLRCGLEACDSRVAAQLGAFVGALIRAGCGVNLGAFGLQ
jgi:hypothetical protein